MTITISLIAGTSQDTPKAISASKRNLKTPTSTNVNVTSDNTTDSPIFNVGHQHARNFGFTKLSVTKYLTTLMLNIL